MPTGHTDKRYAAALAIAAGLVLLGGTLARPAKQDEESKQPTVSQADIVRLQQLARRRALQSMSEHFAEVATAVSPHLVWSADVNATGIYWGDKGTILTPRPKKKFPGKIDVLELSDREIQLRKKLYSPIVPIATVAVTPNTILAPIETTSPNLLSLGEWLVAVARWPDKSYTFFSGTYGGSHIASCGEFEFQEINTDIKLEASMLGGGLFDLDHNLVGIIIRCAGRITTMAAGDVNMALDFMQSTPNKLLTKYGFRVTTEPQSREKVPTGDSPQTLVVTEVWNDSAASRAGLLPFDTIRELDGKPVLREDDLASLLHPEATVSHAIRIRRGSKKMVLQLEPENTFNDRSLEEPKSIGLFLSGPPVGFTIDSVKPRSRADRAGIQAGDRLLEVNGTRVRSERELNRILATSSEKVLRLIVERGDRKRSFLLPASPLANK